jgi:hypothetical protein
MKEDMLHQRAQNYENIYSILIDNVQKAKEKLAHLGDQNQNEQNQEDTDRRIIKQKLEFDALLKEYMQQNKSKESKKAKEIQYLERQLQREAKQE